MKVFPRFENFSLSALIFLFVSGSYGLDLKLLPTLAPQSENETGANKTLATKEAVVDIDGARYREIIYQNKRYYLKSLDREPSDLEPLECMTSRNENDHFISAKHVYGEAAVSHRSQGFLSRLVNDCEDQPDVPHPSGDSSKEAQPTSQHTSGTNSQTTLHPADKELDISFDSKQHRSKATSSTPGGSDGGMD